MMIIEQAATRPHAGCMIGSGHHAIMFDIAGGVRRAIITTTTHHLPPTEEEDRRRSSYVADGAAGGVSVAAASPPASSWCPASWWSAWWSACEVALCSGLTRTRRGSARSMAMAEPKLTAASSSSPGSRKVPLSTRPEKAQKRNSRPTTVDQ